MSVKGISMSDPTPADLAARVAAIQDLARDYLAVHKQGPVAILAMQTLAIAEFAIADPDEPR